MDVNQTRFHLVFGKQDWLGEPDADNWSQLEYRADDATVALPARVFVFPVLQSAHRFTPSDRRGAAQDRFGNFYWIAPSGDEILVLGQGEINGSHFFSGADLAVEPCGPTPLFTPVTPQTAPSYAMSGLAVTEDHYLVAGITSPAGLLVFDLYSGGTPLEYHWPAGVLFVPFDLAPSPGGGVWILDRQNRRYWGLDSLFRVEEPQPHASTPKPVGFFPAAQPALAGGPAAPGETIQDGDAMPLDAIDPIAIEALPDGSVLILDNPPAQDFSQVFHYRMQNRQGAAVALDRLDIQQNSRYRLRGQDIAFTGGKLYIADATGAQTFAFSYDPADPKWAEQPDPTFYPMLRFGGKALVSGKGGVSYDLDNRWTTLAQQPRPRFELSGAILLPPEGAFDGKEPNVVWHRLLMDGTIPNGTQVVVQSRAADTLDLLSSSDWQTEPRPYLRGDGAELPFYRPALRCTSEPTGTWELLFQNARGRYLQLRLTLTGNGRATPRLQSLRAYYPRFSYVKEYLPAVYRENAASASFLERYLANPEGIFTAMEGRVEAAQELFDSRTVPPEYLPWLAGWLGASFDFTWSDRVRRFFLANAPRFFAARGTPEGVARMIRLTLDGCADESLFDPPDQQRFTVRIVEWYLKRTAPGVALGDPNDIPASLSQSAAASWTPSQGAQALDQRFRDYLRTQYTDVAQLNAAWGASFTGFGDLTLRLPAIQPSGTARATIWQAFLRNALGFTYAVVADTDLPLFISFLSRRYGRVAALNQAYRLTGSAALSNFSDIPARIWRGTLAQGLPQSGQSLEDWILFVSTVLPAARNAHRFSVVVPVGLNDDQETQAQRRDLAQRIAQQEKPAHTDFDVRLYWAMFRTGEARLGIETVAGPGSRFTALVLGRGMTAASYVDYTDPTNVRGRVAAGRDQLQQIPENTQ